MNFTLPALAQFSIFWMFKRITAKALLILLIRYYQLQSCNCHKDSGRSKYAVLQHRERKGKIVHLEESYEMSYVQMNPLWFSHSNLGWRLKKKINDSFAVQFGTSVRVIWQLFLWRSRWWILFLLSHKYFHSSE